MGRLLLLSVLTVALAACGGSVTGGAGTGGPGSVSTECAEAVAPFVDGLKSLDSRLDIGLTYADYGDRLGDVKAEYDDVDWASVGQSCVSEIGVEAENALNHYITAFNTWRDCIEDTACDTDSITGDLQAEWASASTRIDLIRERLP